MQLPQVQTALATLVVDQVSESLDGKIVFEKIHFKPFTTLIVKNVVIVDNNPVQNPHNQAEAPTDTLFRAEYVIAKFTLEGLMRNEGIHLNRVFISNAAMNLVIEDKEDKGDGDIVTDNLSRIFRLQKPEKKSEGDKEIFLIRKVEIHNMSFAMKNCQEVRVESQAEGIDWNDLDVREIKLNARELRFKGGVMTGVADMLTFKEKSGYICNDMSGKARVGRGKTIIENLRINDPWSNLNLDLFMMSYENSKAFSDFIHKVKLDGEINTSSRLSFKTLSYFAPELKGIDIRAAISGKVSGYIDDFNISGLKIKSEAGGFAGTLNGRMKGLPKIEETFIDAQLKDFNMTAKGLGNFVSEWMGDKELDLDRFAKGLIFMVTADASGYINNLDVTADISSFVGKVQAALRLDNLIYSDKGMTISGTVDTEDLDLGRIIGTDLIHECSLHTSMSATIGQKDIPVELKIDTLFVDRLYLNGYDYNGIAAVGTLSDKGFNGTIISQDPNLNFMFQGGFALSSKTNNALYKFHASVGHADLNAINIDKRGKSIVQFNTQADFLRTGKGEIFGKIDVDDIILENHEGKYNAGDIHLVSYSDNDTYKIDLDADFADGIYDGNASIDQFIQDMINVTVRKEVPALLKNPDYKWKGNEYNLSFNFHDVMNILPFALPGFYIEKGTSIKAGIDKDGIINAGITSKRIAYREQYMKNIEATLDNKEDNLSGELNAEEIRLSSLILRDNSFMLYANDNHIGLGYTYDNHSELMNRGEFIVNGKLDRNSEGLNLGIDIRPSTLYLNSREWHIQPSELYIKGSEIDVKSLEFISGEQRIHAHGRTSMKQRDTLTLNLDRFDLSIINPLIGNQFGVRGALTGNVSLTSPLSKTAILSDLICDSTFIAGEPLGTLMIGSDWSDEDNEFFVSLRNDFAGKSSMDIRGKLNPSSRDIDLTASLNQMGIGYAKPFISDVFSDMDGHISGNIHINGNMENPVVSSSDTRIENAMLKIAFTNVPYFADGTFHIDNTGAYFDQISIRDRYDGKGSVTGSIDWDNLRDIRFNTKIRVENMECIDLDDKTGEVFYGNLSATGNIAISGPANSMLMNIDAVTTKAGQLHIPITSSMTARESTNLLKFKEVEIVEEIDPYEVMITKLQKQEASTSDLRVKLHVNASPDVEAFVEIDKASGNVLSGRGSGTIELDISNELFDINGDYTLNSGNYKFVAMGVVGRDFEIQDGSSVTFNGDIMESTLNINALYKTKTSLSALLADTTSIANRRTVECGIRITDKLSNPRLGFSIEIPDLDPMVESRVKSALSTEDKVQKQFLSLILSNSFLPDEQSGIVNNSTLLYSNVTEVLTNQLNNIFQKLDIPLDLGLNYQPNEKGNDIFDVAVSTQLFNNRVVVNGNIGNKQYNIGNTQNEVVGDLDIEIKLDRSGAIRLNIFSHSADQFSNYLDNSQRNGIGLTYQTEFNNFGQFIKNIFSRKSKRLEAKRAEEQAMIDGGVVKIEMNSTDTQNGK